MNRLRVVIALIAPAVSAANYGPGFEQKRMMEEKPDETMAAVMKALEQSSTAQK